MKISEGLGTRKKRFSPIDVWAIAFGCMVGWGCFVMPGTTFLPVAGPLGSVLSMTIGTVIMLVIGFNFAFLMKRSPGPGGIYTYTKEAFGRDHAFISAWFLCLSYLTIVFLNGTALFIVLKTLFGDMIKTGVYYTIADNRIYLGELIASVVALVGIGGLLIIARTIMRKFNTLLALLLIGGIIVLSVICIPHAFQNHVMLDFGSSGASPAYGIFSIVFLAPWAFVGFDVISFETPSFGFSVEKSKRIIVVGIIVAGIAYTSMAIVGASAVPEGYAGWAEYISDIGDRMDITAVPTFNAATTYLGMPGLVIIGITSLAGVLTGIIGGYRATVRVLSAMAEDLIISRYFKKTTFSILFVMLFSIILSILGRNTLNWFVDLTSFGAIVAFGYTSAAAYKLAKSENNKKKAHRNYWDTDIRFVCGCSACSQADSDGGYGKRGVFPAFYMVPAWLCVLLAHDQKKRGDRIQRNIHFRRRTVCFAALFCIHVAGQDGVSERNP